MAEILTICMECGNMLRREGIKSHRALCWYNLRCGAQPREPHLDVVTGGTHFGNGDDDPYPPCRDINNGHCADFRRGEPVVEVL